MKTFLKNILPILALIPISFFCSSPAERSEEIPNVVFIFADDMGYGDVSGLNPDSRIQTPSIDRLINNGLTFTEAHASASVCTPSRYGLLTGRYAYRNPPAAGGIGGFDGPVIEKGRETIASLLKLKGYTTGVIGKWHLGVGWQTKIENESPKLDRSTGYSNVDYSKKLSGGPNDYGFDYSFIHPASLDIPPYVFIRNHEVVDPNVILTTDVYPRKLDDTEYSWDKKHSDSLAVYWEKGVWWREGEMSSSFKVEDCLNEIVKEGLGFIDRNSNKEAPFLLYLPLTGPHTPWVPEEQFKDKSPIGRYGDFVLNIDDVVKRVTETLERNGELENTILIFSSDNGAYWPEIEIEETHHDSNNGRRGQKGDIWDGGHHVPLVIHWPAKIKEARVYPHLTSLTDLFATLCDLTGIEKGEGRGEDSFSFWGAMNGNVEEAARPNMTHNSSGRYYAIRKDGWKFIDGLGSGGFTAPSKVKPEPGGPAGQLYDLREDPNETNNLYLEYPEKVEALQSELAKSIE
ncbi:MAG: arylsulfatase [Bacteroidota bacterium]